mmetsp:Transcript_7436/g.20905  ORF Transcript_7436/g.20905 Transcript_7436/m.20905 type:complete len:214 (-) Transcript_7436:790-1431(-)
MSLSWSKAARTSSGVQKKPSSSATASSALSGLPRSIPWTRSFRTKRTSSLPERCSSSTMRPSSSALPESKYSRMASWISVWMCRSSPDPQTLRECAGVCLCAWRTICTPNGPPKRSRRAHFRNSAGKSSCSTAQRSRPVNAAWPALPAFASSPAMPRSLEKPNCRSTSTSSPSSCSRAIMLKAAFCCSAAVSGGASTAKRLAATTASWWKSAF